jgi:hypothetical protein
LSRPWQSTQAVLLAALARITGGSTGVPLICRAAERVGQKQEKPNASITCCCHCRRGSGCAGRIERACQPCQWRSHCESGRRDEPGCRGGRRLWSRLAPRAARRMPSQLKHHPASASVLDRPSRADAIVGRRFTGVFAKIAATELVSPHPPSINLHLARIRPLVSPASEHRLQQGARSCARHRSI